MYKQIMSICKLLRALGLSQKGNSPSDLQLFLLTSSLVAHKTHRLTKFLSGVGTFGSVLHSVFAFACPSPFISTPYLFAVQFSCFAAHLDKTAALEVFGNIYNVLIL